MLKRRAVLVRAVQEQVRASKMPTTADSSIAEVLAAVEQRRELATPTTADSNTAVVPVPVEHRRGLVARTPGLEPHTHTDTGNTQVDNNTGGSSREEDKLGTLHSDANGKTDAILTCAWAETEQCDESPGQHRRSKQFSSSWQLLLKWRSSHSLCSVDGFGSTAV